MTSARCSLPALSLAVAALAACADTPARDAAAADAPAADIARDTLARDVPVADTPATDAALDTSAVDTSAVDTPAADASNADAARDAPAVLDARPDAPAADAARDAPVAADAPPAGPTHVHIEIDNTCRVTVTPTEVTVPVMSRAMFAFHNHSRDYRADVWMSYGGGYLELALGATWNDPIGHCNTPTVHDEYADISIAGGPTRGCPGVRFMIRCR